MVTTLDNNTAYTRASKALDALQIELQQWPQFGPELASFQASLEEMLDHIDDAQMIPQSASPGAPLFLAAAQDLLRGRPVMVSEISDLRKQVSDAKMTVTQWDAANQHAQELTESLKSTQDRSDLTDDDKASLKDIQNKLVAVWEHLFRVTNAADVLAI